MAHVFSSAEGVPTYFLTWHALPAPLHSQPACTAAHCDACETDSATACKTCSAGYTQLADKTCSLSKREHGAMRGAGRSALHSRTGRGGRATLASEGPRAVVRAGWCHVSPRTPTPPHFVHSPPACTQAHCDACEAGSTNKCQTCSLGYTLQLNKMCSLSACEDGAMRGGGQQRFGRPPRASGMSRLQGRGSGGRAFGGQRGCQLPCTSRAHPAPLC